jgi:3',5'-cyclic AMP phosphodiesterase CpdA
MNPRYALAALLAVLLPTLGCQTTRLQPNVIHRVSGRTQTASVRVSGVSTNLKAMQITDAHISLSVPQETNMMKYAARMHNAYAAPRRHYSRETSKSTFAYLDEVLQKAKAENVELLLLTGDIVNFPSAASVGYVCERLKAAGIPWLYVAGNHDWHYEGMEGTPDSLRKTWIERSLLPFYQGRNPLCYSVVVKGINFVAIDNSTGKVSQGQCDFLKAQCQRKEPVIVLSHIPYDLSQESNYHGMDDFVRTLLAQRDNIIAIFAGHTHQSALSFSGNMCQYVSLPCFEGACFVAEIKPMQPAPAR